ncbi:hypothetical protein Tco_0438420 [Tanacetum coccineum]
MSSMQKDIQCAGSDTRPLMLDRTCFESWQQRIHVYCLGKDNGENIMKSIKEGPFYMGTFSDVIAGGTEGAVQQGPVRARVLNDLSAEEKERYKVDIRATNILLQGIPKDIYLLINHYTDAKDIWQNGKRRLSVVVEEKNLLLKTKDEEVANLKAQLLVKEAEATEAIRLCAEVQTLADRNIVLERENGELDIKVEDLAATVKVREQEVADLDAMVTFVKFHNDNLTDQVHKLEASSAVLQDKLVKDLVELALHLEERFYPHLLTTISGRRWLLTHGAAIGKAVEKGMQEGLSAGITHGAASRVLTDVAAYNPSAEADYLSALQRLQSVNFSLISELKSN